MTVLEQEFMQTIIRFCSIETSEDNPVVKELSGIRTELNRIADSLEKAADKNFPNE